MKTLPENTAIETASEVAAGAGTVAVAATNNINFSPSGITSPVVAYENALKISPVAEPVVQEPPLRAGKHCRFIVAALLFIAINAGLSFGTPFDFDPYRFVYKGWAWWTMQALKSDTELHNVALLGSSLVVSAVSNCDANHFLTSFDLTKYHKAGYLDYLLHKRLNGEFNTFNLSAPGQMPSDAYLTLKGMVNVSQRPEVVIYGIAPRDFIDSTLSSPVDTEPFKYLRRIVNIDDVASGLYRSPIPRLDWFLQRTVYLYGNSLDIQMSSNELFTYVMSYVVPQPTKTDRPFTWWDRTHILPKYLAGEIIPNSMMAVPSTQNEAKQRYTDNTDEYRERYKRPEPSIYQTQFYFLRKLASYCHKEKIELVLVNMPLSKENIALLKPEVYQQYLQAIKEFGYNMNYPVIDLCAPSVYSKGDFHDTVHLNAFGGKKFIWTLVDALHKSSRTRRALTLAGDELQRHEEDSKPEKVE
jgi:hypothetical protein